MNQHPYLRAYMAGIVIPTIFLLIIMTAFCLLRYVYDFPVPIERVIVFPMAVVPNLWGLWNILYARLPHERRPSLGLYGAALPLILAPAGYGVTRLLDFQIPALAMGAFPVMFPLALAVYYMAWKHLVGFFNETLGIA